MIKKKTSSSFLLIIITLAAVGLASTFLTSFTLLIKNILLFVISLAVIYSLVYYFVLRERHNKDELRKYRQAAKQSRRRQSKQDHNQITKYNHKKLRSSSKKRTNHPPHLRVIDGKKSSKKGPMSL